MARGSVSKRCPCTDLNGRACKKNHGAWSFVVDVGLVDGKRKQVRRSRFRTRIEAEEAMTEVLRALDRGTWTDDRGVTVGEWLTQWLSEARLSPKTRHDYGKHIELLWTPQIGRLRLRDLRRGHVDAALRTLADKNAPATIDSYRRTLRSALSEAVARELIASNPAQGRIQAIPQRRPTEAQWWEPADTARFLDATAGHPLGALFEVAAYTGLRRGELCGLRWADADDKGVTIRQTIAELADAEIPDEYRQCPSCSSRHRGLYFKRTKSAAGDRWVPLADAARSALKAHRKVQLEDRMRHGTHYADHDLVFCQQGGPPLRPSDVTKAFKDAAAEHGLPEIKLHEMRHSAVSMLSASGMPAETIQQIIGHASASMRKVYTHVLKDLTAEQVQSAAEAISRHRRDQSAIS